MSIAMAAKGFERIVLSRAPSAASGGQIVGQPIKAGVTKRLWEMKDVVDMLEAWEAAQKRRRS